METSIPLNPANQQLLTLVKDSPLPLKLSQQVDVKILTSDILKNSMALKMGDQTLLVTTDQALPSQQSFPLPKPGDILKLQVIKLLPTIEFKIVTNKQAIPTSSNTNQNAVPQSLNIGQRELKLILTAVGQPYVNPEEKLTSDQNSTIPSNLKDAGSIVGKPTAALSTSNPLELKLTKPEDLAKLINPGQSFKVQVIMFSPNAIQLQIVPEQKPAALSPQITTNGNFEQNKMAVDSQEILDFIPSSTKIPASVATSTPVFTLALNQLKILPSTGQSVPNGTPALVQDSQFQIKPGQILDLEAVSNNDTLEFHIQYPETALRQTHLVNEILRQLLPQQAAPELLLNQLLQQPAAKLPDVQISELLQRIAQRIISTLPNIQELTYPQKLKQAVTDSGVFLEAKLPQLLSEQPPELKTDLKLTLLKILAELKHHQSPANSDPVPKPATETTDEMTLLKELQRKTEGSIAKLVLDQLASLPKDDSPKQTWNVEIPFINQQVADKVSLEIEHDASRQNAAGDSPSWSVTITLTLPGLDTLHCKVSFLENSVNAYFRSDNTQTLDLLQKHLDQLRTQFENVGLNPGFINTQAGNFEKTLHQKITCTNLFNAKA